MSCTKRTPAKMASHGSLTKAGKVKSQTPKILKTVNTVNRHHPLTKHKRRYKNMQKRKPHYQFRRRDQRR
ncbi:MAG: 30S ribosomal protein S30e [Nitrososphaerales archaeon]